MFMNSSSPSGLHASGPNMFLIPVIWIPIHIQNMAPTFMGVGFSPRVLLNFMPSHNRNTTIPITTMDNAGILLGGGIVSKTAGGLQQAVTSSMTVLVENSPVTRLGDMGTQNGGNATGTCVTPSQTKVMALS